jgi:ATP-dependent DNA helicase DinG
METHFTDDSRALMRFEIAQARGNELFFIGHTNLEGVVCEVEAIARGSKQAVPAILSRASGSDMVIHNHPGGDLTPSAADMDIASVAGNQGIGFAIVDNDCSRCYLVVSPHLERKGELLSLEEIGRVFGSDGLLARSLTGYEQRDEQLRMALTVAEAFNRDRVALVEAGTGTGKSLAYLVPSIIWAVRNNERVVISTNTINLQEQLIRKDLPFLARHCGVDFKAALIKGRGNYACLRKLEAAEAEPSLFPDESSSELTAIIEWSKGARDGCRSDLSFIPRSGAWEEVCCEADQCGRSRCKQFNRCFFYRARRDASAARILVVNHALLLSDIVLKRESGYDATAILPPFSRLILDEGHHLEEVATSHLSLIISRNAILKQLHRLVPAKANRAGLLNILSNRLARDLPESLDGLYEELSALLETSLLPKSQDVALLTEQTMDWVALAVGRESGEEGKERKLRITGEVEQRPFWQELRQRLRTLSDALADYGSGLRTVVRRCEDLPEQLKEKLAGQILDIAGIEGRLHAMTEGLLFMIGDPEGYCRWIEASTAQRGLQARLCAAPLDIAGQIKQSILDRLKTIVVTSATLTVGGEFGYLKRRTGFTLLDSGRLDELRLASPFDYASQVFAAVPDDMPDPTAPGFREALQESILRSVSISRGGAFILFTSHDLLRKVHSALAPELSRRGLTPLRQGETGRHTLLARFRREHNAVLFGTDSFWEGVDVKGEALRLVIITRLPFQVPTEPVQQARCERIDATGGNSFREFSIPQAVIKFRQGFGRLIRSREDRGAVLILDRRVTTKGYGRTFLRSLPDTELVRGSSDELFARMESFFSANDKGDPGVSSP